MKENEIKYKQWLIRKIRKDDTHLYKDLLDTLYQYDFRPILTMDNNRYEDGRSLRRRFFIETNIVTPISIDDRCSILEMMVAMSIIIEERIMVDDDYGDRTSTWFWNMIESMGLISMDDNSFNKKFVGIVLEKFNDRQYHRTGKGGLFTIEGITKDMRDIEIWYQMCWFLDTIIN